MTTYLSQLTRVRQLFSTLAAATASNPVLLEGEKWSEKSSTTGRFTGRTKTGDGVVTGTAPNQTISGTAFNALPFDPTSGGGDPAGTADAAIAAHVAAADPHSIYTTAQEAAAAAPVQSVALTPPSGWSASAANVGGSVTLTLALPAGYSLPSNASQANWDTAYSERLRWDGDASGLNAATGRASLGLGTAATAAATDYATAAQGTDSREWSAPTVDQPTAEAGVSTTRVAYNPLRVSQAIAAWWAASAFKTKLDGVAAGATANSPDATLLARTNHTGTQAANTITGLAAVATSGAYTDLSGRFDPTTPGAIGGSTAAAGSFTALSAGTSLLVPSAAAGSPAAGHIYRVGDQLRYRDSSNAEQVVLYGGGNLANLANNATARSNLGFGTLPSGALVGTTDAQKISNKELGNLRETTYTITDAAAFEIDPANGPIQTITLGANRTPAATNFASGQSVKLKIDDGTNYAITWTTVGVVWIGQTAGSSGTTPTLGATGWTHIELFKEGSIIYGALIGYSAT